MANPKQKRSKANTRSRRSNWKTTAPAVSTCPQCHQPRRPHYACSNCGYYNGGAAIEQPNKTARAKAERQVVYGVRISGIGGYAPAGGLTNQDLEHLVETRDEGVCTTTG